MNSKIIGVLVIDIEGAYSKMIWQEVARHTRSQGYDLLVLPANNPKCPYNFRSQFNSLYNFINQSVIDALIFVPSILGNFLYAEEAEKLLSDIKQAIPVVSLNTAIPHFPSLLIDNTTGIDAAVRHLVDVHQFSRIGFLEGPQDNIEARERKQAYFDALNRVGIRPMPDWIIPCDFTAESAEALGNEAATTLVENLDALIAANDYMAMGLLRSFEKQGFHIPDDLAIVGFDDIKEAPFLRPSLTTIGQPFAKLASRAAKLAIDLCEGRKVAQIERFDTELVIRASCGCDDYISEEILKSPIVDIKGEPKFCIEHFLKDRYNQPTSERLFAPVFQLLSFALNETVCEENKRRFLKILATALENEFFQFDTDPNWSQIFSFIIDFLVTNDTKKLEEWQKINLFERSRYLISRKQKLWNGYKEFLRHENHTIPLRQTIENLALVQNRHEMVSVLKRNLPLLKVRSCILTLLEDGETTRGLFGALPALSRVYLNYSQDTADELTTDQVFPTLQLWPAQKPKTVTGKVWLAGPLFNREQLYGFIISDIIDFDSWTFESLRHQISITLHSCYLSSEREKAEARLRHLLGELSMNNRKLKQESLLDEMTGLYNRRGFKHRVEKLLQHHSRKSTRYALFFADMDGLKKINDTLGHSEGDRAIIDMATIFKQVFRSEDVVARFGGDEFAAFTLNVPRNFKTQIDIRVKTLLDQFHQTQPRSFKLSFSVGAIMSQLDSRPLDLNILLKRADEKLYEQKRYRKTHRP